MTIVYQCRYCSREIGQINRHVADEAMLGLDQLSSEEKRDMLNYEANGDIRVTAICEHCETSLTRHPHYHELDFFLQ